MQPDKPRILTPEENNAIFINEIVPEYFGHDAHLEMPELHVIGAQPGSGKSTLNGRIDRMLKNRFGMEAVVSIMGDKFRAFHPDYQKFLEIDAIRAGNYTSTDLSRWVKQSVEFTAQQRNCVIIEGTFREPEVNIWTASQYLKQGFTAHLHVMAVHEFESRLRIFQRYFNQNQENSSYGRYTPLDAHDRSYKALPESVIAIVNSSLFKAITLYDQHQEPIVTISLPNPDAGKNISEVFEKRRDNKHVDTARILLCIDALLTEAKGHGEIYSDLLELRENVLSGNEKYFVPNAPSFGMKELKALGCEHDPETDQWYHTDPVKAQEARRLVGEREQQRGHDVMNRSEFSGDKFN